MKQSSQLRAFNNIKGLNKSMLVNERKGKYNLHLIISYNPFYNCIDKGFTGICMCGKCRVVPSGRATAVRFTILVDMILESFCYNRNLELITAINPWCQVLVAKVGV